MNSLIGVGAVIRSGDMVLVQDHVKSGCWTIPVGKAEKAETPLEAITRELWEELGLIVVKGECFLVYINFHFYPIMKVSENEFRSK